MIKYYLKNLNKKRLRHKFNLKPNVVKTFNVHLASGDVSVDSCSVHKKSKLSQCFKARISDKSIKRILMPTIYISVA